MSDSERERAAIVKWLRMRAHKCAGDNRDAVSSLIASQTLNTLAYQIENGDHMEATNET